MRYPSRARVNPRNPQAFGICDRCGRQFNLVDLRNQFVLAGNAFNNTHLRVCRQCMDEPNEQLRARNIPADPVPVPDPRPRRDNAS